MTEKNAVYGPFFGMVGATAAMTLCALGAEYGTAKAGTAISAAGTRKPEAVMRTLLPVVMAGIIAIYGLVAAVLIANDIKSSEEGYTLYKGFLHLGAGVSVGMAGLGGGYAIGVAGAAGVLGTVHQPSLFVGMILILIFAEVLGLYGLIIALLLCSK